MKKIFYAFAVILAGLASACSNDDIEITGVGRTQSLTASINTQNVYDEFDLTSSIRSLMRDESYAIGIYSFLYDSNGNLIAEKASRQFTFNNVTENFTDLLEGTYTLVTVETVVDPDLDDQSPAWSFQGTEKLSTLQLSQDRIEVYYPFVLGVSTSEVVINGGDKSIAVSPKAIGSIVELYFLNFDKSSHVQVGLGTRDVISSYKLDPSLSKNSRYSTDLTKSGYINMRCRKDIDSNNIYATRYILESSIQYEFCFVKAENEGTGTWTHYGGNEGTLALEDGKTYNAGFYYVDSNTIPSHYFGSESGFEDWYKQITTTNTDKELIPSSVSTDWGSSVNTIQSAMNGYTLTAGSSGHAIAQSDGSYMLNYSGKGKESNILYFFTSETTGLFEADVLYDKSSVTSSEILAYLNANFTYLTEESGTYMYYTSDFRTFVLFFETNGVWDIGLVDVNYVNNSNLKAHIPRRVAKNIKSLGTLLQKGETTKTEKFFEKRTFYKDIKDVK